MRTLDFWEAALKKLRDGQSIFVGMVADHTRHSPGTRGARLLLDARGEIMGTIGGGIMEARLLEEGRAALREPGSLPQARELFHRKQAQGQTSGLICAGRQTNVSALLHPAHAPLMERVVARLRADAPGLLTLHSDGEWALAQEHEVGAPVRLVSNGPHQWRYEEQLLAQDRVAIFGAGHCGQALTQLMAQLGYVVTLVDVREDVWTLGQSDGATHMIIASDYAESAARVSHPALTPAIVMTADFPSDTRALIGALGEPFPFIGLMGAPAKLRAIDKALAEHGFDTTQRARLSAPVGLAIGSSTPAEIAVSVAAQLIQLRPQLFPWRAPSPFQAPQEVSS